MWRAVRTKYPCAWTGECAANSEVKGDACFPMKKIELFFCTDKKRSLSDLSLLLEVSSLTALFILHHLHKIKSRAKITHTHAHTHYVIVWKVGQNTPSSAGSHPSNKFLICIGALTHRLACCHFCLSHARTLQPTFPPSAWYSFSSALRSLARPKSVILTCWGVFTKTFLAAKSRCTRWRSSR